jgi:hypothetical protein
VLCRSPGSGQARLRGRRPPDQVDQPKDHQHSTASRMTTRAVGLPQNAKIRANSATALIRNARRCAYVHSPTGPVLTPACWEAQGGV